jgi:hypothetical protein
LLFAWLGNPLFVAHVVHVNSGIALKLLQAVNGAEIERFRMIVMAGSSISNADFHFADWIDRHGNPPLPHRFGKCGQGFSAKQFRFQQLATGTWQLAQLKQGLSSVLKLRIRETTSKKNLAANEHELENEIVAPLVVGGKTNIALDDQQVGYIAR